MRVEMRSAVRLIVTAIEKQQSQNFPQKSDVSSILQSVLTCLL